MGDYKTCPLHWLVYSDDYYRHLEARLEDPNERHADGNTLLQAAAQSPNSNSRTVQLLIDRGADVDSAKPDGHTALHFAVAGRKRDAVGLLLEAGASVNAEDSEGRTALHLSVCKAYSCRPNPLVSAEFDRGILKTLMRRPDIHLNPADGMGETPLMWAVKERNSEAVGALLKKGADPDVSRLLDNRTALHEALYALNPDVGIVSALLTHGAGIYRRDTSHQTAVDVLIRSAAEGFDDSLPLAKRALALIALRYRARAGLWRALERSPALCSFFRECLGEVACMRRLVVSGRVTLHDFCLDCFQTLFDDPFKPAVEMLLSGLFQVYYELIYSRLSGSDLRGVLDRTVGRSFVLDVVPSGWTADSVMLVIRRVYGHSDELKRHLLEIRRALGKSSNAS